MHDDESISVSSLFKETPHRLLPTIEEYTSIAKTQTGYIYEYGRREVSGVRVFLALHRLSLCFLPAISKAYIYVAGIYQRRVYSHYFSPTGLYIDLLPANKAHRPKPSNTSTQKTPHRTKHSSTPSQRAQTVDVVAWYGDAIKLISRCMYTIGNHPVPIRSQNPLYSTLLYYK